MVEAPELQKPTRREKGAIRPAIITILALASQDEPISLAQIASQIYPDDPMDKGAKKVMSQLHYVKKDLEGTDQSIAIFVKINPRTRRNHFYYYLENKSEQNEDYFTLSDIAIELGIKPNKYSLHAVHERITRAAAANPDLIQGPLRGTIAANNRIQILYTQEQFENIVAAVPRKPVIPRPGGRRLPTTEINIERDEVFTPKHILRLARKVKDYTRQHPSGQVDWQNLANFLNLSQGALKILIYVGFCLKEQPVTFRSLYGPPGANGEIALADLYGYLARLRWRLMQSNRNFKNIFLSLDQEARIAKITQEVWRMTEARKPSRKPHK